MNSVARQYPTRSPSPGSSMNTSQDTLQNDSQNAGEQPPLIQDQKPERRKGRRRSKTIAQKRLSRLEIQQGIELADMMGYRRPGARSQCETAQRPCPYVACKHHLYLDVNPDTGSIKLNFPDVPVWEMKETCALDIADRGGVTLEEVGEILNLTRERIRQVEVMGLEKLRETEFAEDLTGMKVVEDR